MKQAEAACAAAVKDQLQPALEKTAVEVLGNRSEGWFQFAIDEASNSPVLLFHYLSGPRTFDDILGALADLERRINSGAS